MAAKLVYQGQDILMGYMIKVENQARRLGEPENWIALQMEDVSGDQDTERCLLLTEKEIERLSIVECRGLELKFGRFYPFEKGRFVGYLVRTRQYTPALDRWFEVTYAISERFLALLDARRERNPEDLTVKGWWTDLRD